MYFGVAFFSVLAKEIIEFRHFVDAESDNGLKLVEKDSCSAIQ